MVAGLKLGERELLLVRLQGRKEAGLCQREKGGHYW
jgi:hypothetical protein